MNKEYCLALVILLMADMDLADLAAGYNPTYIPNTNYRSSYDFNPGYNSFASPIQLGGYRPTYIPNSNYGSFAPPIQLGVYNDQQTVEPSPASHTILASYLEMVQEKFIIVGDSNEPIANAQVSGSDGSGKSFQEFTDDLGIVVINGASGNWQLTASASGYSAKSVNLKFEYSSTETLTLQKIGLPGDPNKNIFGFSINNIQASDKPDVTIPNWLCESNGYSEQDSDMTQGQSTGADGRG